MQMRSFFLSAGLGMAAGAAVILMLPTQSPVRQAANRAAKSVEQAVQKAADTMLH